jgi:LacI family transcriptional regulator
MICQTHENLKNEKAAIQTLVNARVDAILLSVSLETTGADHLSSLRDKGIRLFFFDRILESVNVGSVMIDDRLGAYQSVTHLLGKGYRRIVHVGGTDQINIYRARKKGYLDAMNEAGIDIKPQWVMEKPLVLEGGESAFQDAMRMKQKPEAFFCAGDFAALGLMQAALKKGIRIPDDLGITGFANEPFTAFLNPSLTTVDQRGNEMGRIVAEMFMDCNENDSASPDCKKTVLEPRLIIRNSSLPNR